MLKLRSESRFTPRFLASVEHLKPLASKRVETVGRCLFGPKTMNSVLLLLRRRKLFDIQEFIAVRQSVSGVSDVGEIVSIGSMDR